MQTKVVVFGLKSVTFNQNIQFSGGFKSLVLKHCYCKSVIPNCNFNYLLLRTRTRQVMESVFMLKYNI